MEHPTELEVNARATGRTLLFWCLGIAALAVLVLTAYASLFQPSRFHVQDMYVDQAGYIMTARILAETGELRNGVLFPAQLDDPSFHVHMPGHSLTLSLFYRLFGFGVFQSLLPSLVSFVLAAVGTFLIGNRLDGRASGAFAAALFVLFPANVAYAFTAMAELTFTLACVATVALFVHLPARRRWLAPPLLLVLPFLFRESGAFLIVPLALLVLREHGLPRAAATTLGSIASLWLVNRWQIASGKLAASLAWVTGGGYNYGDAFADPAPGLSASQWFDALARNVERNLAILEETFAKSPGELMPWCLYVMFGLAAIAIAGGAVRARRSPFALGAGLLMLLVFVLSVALYDVKLHKMMRSAMFTVPFGAVAVASALRVECGGHDTLRPPWGQLHGPARGPSRRERSPSRRHRGRAVRTRALPRRLEPPADDRADAGRDDRAAPGRHGPDRSTALGALARAPLAHARAHPGPHGRHDLLLQVSRRGPSPQADPRARPRPGAGRRPHTGTRTRRAAMSPSAFAPKPGS